MSGVTVWIRAQLAVQHSFSALMSGFSWARWCPSANCRDVKSVDSSTAVLVTTEATERVPDVLAAGCDGVLLKPLAPNLFYTRIGRLLGRGTNCCGRARGGSMPSRSI